MGKSQVTLAIIVGLVIVIALGVLLAVVSNRDNISLGSSSEDAYTTVTKQNDLDTYIFSCLKKTVINAEIEYGLNRQVSPPLIKQYILSKLPVCLDDFKTFRNQGFNVEKGELGIDVEITQQSLVVEMSYPLTFTSKDYVLSFDFKTYTIPRVVVEELNQKGQTKVVSSDGMMIIEVPPGTVATLDGEAVEEIGIKILDREFDGLSNSVLTGMLAYSGIPHGVQFSKPVKVTYFYDQSKVPVYYNESMLSIGYYDKAIGVWVGLPTEVDPDRNKITTYTTHFSQYASVKDCKADPEAKGYLRTPTLVREDCLPCEQGWDNQDATGYLYSYIPTADEKVIDDNGYPVPLSAIPAAEVPPTGTSASPPAAVAVATGFVPECLKTFPKGTDYEDNIIEMEEDAKYDVIPPAPEAPASGTPSAENPVKGALLDNDRRVECSALGGVLVYEFNGELKLCIGDMLYTDQVKISDCICLPPVYYYDVTKMEDLKGQNEYKVVFKASGDSCISTDSAKTFALIDGTTEFEDGKSQIIITPVCSKGDDCSILKEADFPGKGPKFVPEELSDKDKTKYPTLTFNVEVKNKQKEEACIEAYAVLEFQGIGGIDAEYICGEENKDKIDFVKGECRKCQKDEADGLYKWVTATGDQCYTGTTCSPSLRGIVRLEGITCQVCSGTGTWETDTTGQACTQACKDEELYNEASSPDPAATEVDPLADQSSATEADPLAEPPPAGNVVAYPSRKDSITGKVGGMDAVTGNIIKEFCCSPNCPAYTVPGFDVYCKEKNGDCPTDKNLICQIDVPADYGTPASVTPTPVGSGTPPPTSGTPLPTSTGTATPTPTAGGSPTVPVSFEKKENGEECSLHRECLSLFCAYDESNSKKKCSDRLENGEICTEDIVCKSDRCDHAGGNLLCMERLAAGSFCTENSDCLNYNCQTYLVGLGGWCIDSLEPNLDLCDDWTECESRNCQNHACMPRKEFGSTCNDDDMCFSEYCINNVCAKGCEPTALSLCTRDEACIVAGGSWDGTKCGGGSGSNSVQCNFDASECTTEKHPECKPCTICDGGFQCKGIDEVCCDSVAVSNNRCLVVDSSLAPTTDPTLTTPTTVDCILNPSDPSCTPLGTVPVTPGVIPPVTPGTGTTCTTDEDCADGQKCVDGICQDNGGGNNNCYEGDITEVCPGVDLAPYYGKTFTIADKSVLDTRNQKLCDEYGDFPGDFYGSDVALKDVPLKIFEKGASSWPNQVYGAECWVLVEAQKSGDDGKPDFYVRYTDIKDYLGGGKACEEDDDCDKGFVCKDNICVKDVIDVDVEIEPLIGISMLPIDDFPEAKKFNARTVGYFGSDLDDAISKAESENLELFVSYTGDIDDMVEDSQVTGYMMAGDDCKDSKLFKDNLDDYVSDYEEFRKTNKKTPVIRNLGDLECAEDYIDKAKGKVADIIMFDITYDDFQDTAKPDYIYKQKKKAAQLIKKAGEEGWEAFAIVPQVVVDTEEGIATSGWIQDVGKLLVEDSKIDGKVVKDVFYGIVYSPWNGGTGEAIEEVKVAFMSNQPKDNAEVLALIKEEKADMIVHIGNMGYEDAKDWKSMLYGTLGEKDGTKTKLLPYLPIKGEEDSPYEEKPIKWSGYQSVFKSILESAEMKEKGFKCTYNSATMIGEKMVCTYKNLYFIVSGLGFPPLVEDQETFIKSAAEMSTDAWKICTWHKSNANLKVGDKLESAARKYYQACIDNSAIVVNGYERNYARTKTITDLNIKYDEDNAEIRTPILVTGEADKITLANKKGLVINSGLAGGSTPYDLVNHAADDWWASYVTPNRYMKSGVVQEAPIFGNGALFMTFNADKDSNKARGEFKAKIMGEVKVLDSFEITRSITQEVPTYIYDVKDSQAYIDAFKYVFDKAKKAFVEIDRCATDFTECSTKSECEATDFLWDDDNEECVQCFDVEDCCEDCDDMVCEDNACQDK